MSEKTLKLDKIRVDRKDFHISKQPIGLDLVNVNQIVTSDKFKHIDDGFKYLIGYEEGEIVKPFGSSYLKWVDTQNILTRRKMYVFYD